MDTAKANQLLGMVLWSERALREGLSTHWKALQMQEQVPPYQPQGERAAEFYEPKKPRKKTDQARALNAFDQQQTGRTWSVRDRSSKSSKTW